MNDLPPREPHPAAASEIPEPRTRIPRAAQARALLHEPEVDPPFVAMLRVALPDEEARLADLKLSPFGIPRNPNRLRRFVPLLGTSGRWGDRLHPAQSSQRPLGRSFFWRE